MNRDIIIGFMLGIATTRIYLALLNNDAIDFVLGVSVVVTTIAWYMVRCSDSDSRA